MAVRTYFGYTKSGKSTLANHVVSQWKKVIIFDKAHCFKGDIFEDPSMETFKNLFRKYSQKNEFRIVIRPGRLANVERLCDDTIKLASALGRLMGKGVVSEECLQLVIDEADSVCSANYQSPKLKFIVNEGRHDNVDTHFIARNPNRVHTDIRANTTKIFAFRLGNALEIPFLVHNFGRETTQKLQHLKPFWHFSWDDTGVIGLYDEKYKLVRDFSEETEEFLSSKPSKKLRRKS